MVFVKPDKTLSYSEVKSHEVKQVRGTRLTNFPVGTEFAGYYKIIIMAQKNLLAEAKASINAKPGKVWDALTDPAAIKKYMFGTTVTSNWKKGGKISWKGEFKGKPYEDKGEILDIIPEQKLQYSHFSPLSGAEDKPENYHTVTINLNKDGEETEVRLIQDKNATEDEKKHSQENWEMMLKELKKVVEEKSK